MKRKFSPLDYFFCMLAAGILIVFVQGCGIIAILGSEPESSKKIPAEFKFDVSKDKKDKKDEKDKKVLVLVNQPSWLNAPPLLQQMITEQIQKRLMLYAGLKNFNLISYEALSQYRSGEENYSSMTAPQIGTALGANWVLLADLTDFKFGNIGESEYYSGSLSGRTFVVETANSEKLWPEDAENKKIDVGFEASKDGPQGSLAHLAAAFAHCATRHFFDCPKSSFKIAEDRIASSLNEWGN